jgi:hypothetical protein
MEQLLPSRAVRACAEFPNDNPALHRGAIWCCVELGGDAVCLEAALSEMARTVESEDADPAVAEVLASVAELVAVGTDADAIASTEPTPTEPIVPTAVPTGVADEVTPEEDAFVEPAAAPESGTGAAGDVEVEIEIEGEIGLSYAVHDEPPEQRVVHADADGPAEAPAEASQDPFARLGDVLADTARASGADDEAIQRVRALLGFARVDAAAWPEAMAEALISAGMLERTARGLARAEGFVRQVLGWQGILRGESDDFDACGAAMLDEWSAALLARVTGNPSRAEGLRRELRLRGVAAFGLVADAA